MPLRDERRKRHQKLAEPIAYHLRFDLAQAGRIDEAVTYIRRILAHRRLAPEVLGNPLSGRLPYVITRRFSAPDFAALADLLRAMRPEMSPDGAYHLDFVFRHARAE